MTIEQFTENILNMINRGFENLVSRLRLSDRPVSGIPFIKPGSDGSSPY